MLRVVAAISNTVADKEQFSGVRVRAIIFLMLYDIEHAEKIAIAHMPNLLPLIRVERLYPSMRGDPQVSGTPFREALEKILFSEKR